MRTRPRLLLLEDNLLDVELLQNWLEADGLLLELVSVSSQEQFETAVREGNWDLIVSDRNLPKYDGVSALQFKGANSPNVAFIFFSGALPVGESVERFLGLGATAYILKSEPQRLLAEIRRVLSHREITLEKQRAGTTTKSGENGD